MCAEEKKVNRCSVVVVVFVVGCDSRAIRKLNHNAATTRPITCRVDFPSLVGSGCVPVMEAGHIECTLFVSEASYRD